MLQTLRSSIASQHGIKSSTRYLAQVETELSACLALRTLSPAATVTNQAVKIALQQIVKDRLHDTYDNDVLPVF